VLCQGIIERYTVIQCYRNEQPVRLMCRCLKVVTVVFMTGKIVSQVLVLKRMNA
jgi:hypothetical protein